jgi:hypothetical protein
MLQLSSEKRPGENTLDVSTIVNYFSRDNLARLLVDTSNQEDFASDFDRLTIGIKQYLIREGLTTEQDTVDLNFLTNLFPDIVVSNLQSKFGFRVSESFLTNSDQTSWVKRCIENRKAENSLGDVMEPLRQQAADRS